MQRNMIFTHHKFSFFVLKHLKDFTRNLSFQDLSIDHSLLKKLNRIGIREPTEIQSKAWDHLQNGRSVVLNSETGSGKTLAYALPLVQSLRHVRKTEKIISTPYAVIITPNMELAYQVGNTFRHLTSRVCVANEDMPLNIKDNDIIVTTSAYINTYPLNILNAIQTLVVDEADILISKKVGKHGKKDPLFNLIKHFLLPENFSFSSNVLKRQFVFVGATMPNSKSKKSKMPLPYIKSWIPDIEVLQVSNTHKLTPLTDMKFTNVLEANKPKQLVESIGDFYLTNQVKLTTFRIIVFVNQIETANFLQKYLTQKPSKDFVESGHAENDFIASLNQFQWNWSDKIYLLHKKIPLEERLYTFEQFSTSQNALLITTDVSARGLDFPGVDLVFQYDFATNAMDVLHRAGRTARMGREGSVINFVTSSNELLASAIQQVIETEQPLDELFSRHRSLQRKLKRREQREILNTNQQHSLKEDVFEYLDLL